MKEVFTMWRYTKMVVLTALTAAVYAAILIPFKGLIIVPGFTEIRPATAVPVVFGLLFGPAGAWGSAIGNLIGDFFGTLSFGSLPGFLGNFFFGFIGYKLWGHMGIFSSGKGLETRNGRSVFEFILICILSSAVCASVIAWGLEVLGLLPFAILGSVITANNALTSIVLGPFLLWLLYPRVKRWDLLWTDIMEEKDVSKHPAPRIGALLMWVGGLGALILGIGLSTGLYGAHLFTFGMGKAGGGVVFGVLPFLVLFLIGCLLT